LRQTIGVGRATVIDRLEIYWPTSNETQTFRQVPLGRLLQIAEGDGHYTTLPIKRFSFARTRTRGH
jgi:hypothetical protein